MCQLHCLSYALARVCFHVFVNQLCSIFLDSAMASETNEEIDAILNSTTSYLIENTEIVSLFAALASSSHS